MSAVRRGEVWSAQTPGQPHDPHQPRPVLIISDDVRNSLADDVLVVPAFSRGRLGPTRVALTAGQGGIAHDSVLFCEEISCLHEDFLCAGPMGPPAPRAILGEVVKAIRRSVGEVVV